MKNTIIFSVLQHLQMALMQKRKDLNLPPWSSLFPAEVCNTSPAQGHPETLILMSPLVGDTHQFQWTRWFYRSQGGEMGMHTLRAEMKESTSSSLTRATTQPPQPAPVNLAPIAPLRRQRPTKLSNSGQLVGQKQRWGYVRWEFQKHKVCYKVNKGQSKFKYTPKRLSNIPAFVQKAAARMALVHELP